MNRGQRRASWLAQHRNAIRATRGAPGSGLNGRGASSSSQVHVEELVLHGFPPASGYSIGDATQQELIRILTTRGLPSQMTQDTTRVSAGSFQLPPGAQPKAIGALVAKAVYGGSKR
jgi:hypothetical protein